MGKGGNPKPNVGNLKPMQKGGTMPRDVVERATKNAARTKMYKKLIKDIAQDIFYRDAHNKNGDAVIDPETGEHMTLVEIFLNRVLKKAVEVMNDSESIKSVKELKDAIDVAEKIQELLGQKELNISIANAITNEQMEKVKSHIATIGKLKEVVDGTGTDISDGDQEKSA